MTQAFLSFLQRFRNAGITPTDSRSLRQQKTLLFCVSGLVCLVATLWLLAYWLLGVPLSARLAIALQTCIVANMLAYTAWGGLRTFRTLLLFFLLLFPFLAQWALGDFISASGLSLWGLLAPLCALLCLGVAESAPWFLAYVLLTLLAGGYAYVQATPSALPPDTIPRQIIVLFFALNFAALSILIYLSMRFALGERDWALQKLADAHTRLAAEQSNAERLLLNILPASVAERLKAPGTEIADGFPNATVMFADIVNFTELAAHMEPKAVFALLNHVFGKFDELAEQRGLEKIKTIGDAYMVAGGLNETHADPAQAIAELALDMRDWLLNQEDLATPLQLRIGISSGPVAAGVVGRKKFIYDLWGDTVNLAHRITSESMPNTILCDSRTFLHLKYRFVFEDPVTLRLKGKGMVSVWNLLHRPMPAPSPSLDLDLDLSL